MVHDLYSALPPVQSSRTKCAKKLENKIRGVPDLFLFFSVVSSMLSKYKNSIQSSFQLLTYYKK